MEPGNLPPPRQYARFADVESCDRHDTTGANALQQPQTGRAEAPFAMGLTVSRCLPPVGLKQLFG